jgi:hypothetical protein
MDLNHNKLYKKYFYPDTHLISLKLICDKNFSIFVISFNLLNKYYTLLFED